MAFQVIDSPLPGMLLIKPDRYDDARGFFMESYRADSFATIGLSDPFLQDNHSRSRYGTIRRLHFQWDRPMGKLMRVTVGKAFVVAVDIRPGSQTLGCYNGLELDAADPILVWAPAGFARGFCALSEWTEVQYKCTAIYHPHGEGGIRWNDPDLAIPWPVPKPLLSPKDELAPTLREWLDRPESEHFRCRAGAV